MIDKAWIACPKAENSSQRTKFSPVDDALLLLGLKKFGSKYR